MSKIMVLLAGLAAVALLALTACTVEDPAAANEAVSGKPATALSKDMAKVKMGMSEAQVVAILGKPDDAQVMDSQGSHSEMWYYGGLSNQWQIAFDDIMGPYGVTSRNHY